MIKLVILVEPPADWENFELNWPQFLHFAEDMPGLQREATSQVDTMLFGSTTYSLMHELFFDSLIDAQKAMASPSGQEAGRILQKITGGKLALFFADYKEDHIENLRRYRQSDASAG